jgi:Rieske Fe-S protein
MIESCRPCAAHPFQEIVMRDAHRSLAPLVPESSGDVCPRRLDRRAFLRDTALAVAAALAATGMAPGEAFAAQVSALVPVTATPRTRTYSIPASDGVQVDAADAVVLARWQGVLYAFSVECPHRGADLQWRPDEQRLFCPKHKSRYAPNGSHVSGRATRDLDRYSLKRTGANVVLALDQKLESQRDAAAWQSAPLKL